MSEERFSVRLRRECDGVVYSFFDGDKLIDVDMIVDLLNEQQEQLDLYKEAILTMLGLLADKGIIFSGVKDE